MAGIELQSFEKWMFKLSEGIVQKADSIKNIKVTDECNFDHEWYLYKFRCILTGKVYIGIHKDNGEIYWHSGTHEEFKKVFEDKNSQLELIIYETHNSEEYMRDLENREITNAIKRLGQDRVWNKSKGIVKNATRVRGNEVIELGKKIDNNHFFQKDYVIKKESIPPFYQSREFLKKNSHVKNFVKLMNSKGNANDLTHVVIFKNFDGLGMDRIFGGIHCCHALSHPEQKHATEIKGVHVVPEEEYEKWTTAELIAFGNILNKKEKKKEKKLDVSEEAGIRTVYHIYKKNPIKNYWTKTIIELLEAMGFDDTEISKIKKGVQRQIDDESKYSRDNLIWYDYEDYEKDEKVKQLKTLYPNHTIVVKSPGASASVLYWGCKLLDEWSVSGPPPNTEGLVLLIYYTLPRHYDSWNGTQTLKDDGTYEIVKGEKHFFQRTVKKLLPLGMSSVIEDLNPWVSDTGNFKK